MGHKFTDSYGKEIDNTDLRMLLKDRIDFCIDNNLTPYFKKNKNGKIIIVHDILEEVRRRGIDSDRITSLRQLA